MGALGRSNRGFIFLDTLIAIFILVIGIGGVASSIVGLNRFVRRERAAVVELIDRRNEIELRWHETE